MAYFEIVRASGGYRAQFWSSGRLVWWTEVYDRKAGAVKAIATMKREAAEAPVRDPAAPKRMLPADHAKPPLGR